MYICSRLPSFSLLSILSFLPFLLIPLESPHVHPCSAIIVIIVTIVVIVTITITIIGLVLGSTNEREHVIFGLLSLAYLTQLGDLQFHPFSCRQQNFILL
jgi:hypothetical protein